MLFKLLLALVTIVQLVVSQSVDEDNCKDYVIINVRGTLEPPGKVIKSKIRKHILKNHTRNFTSIPTVD